MTRSSPLATPPTGVATHDNLHPGQNMVDVNNISSLDVACRLTVIIASTMLTSVNDAKTMPFCHHCDVNFGKQRNTTTKQRKAKRILRYTKDRLSTQFPSSPLDMPPLQSPRQPNSTNKQTNTNSTKLQS